MWQPGRTLKEMEKEVIQSAMRFYHGNKTHVANSLGIAIRTLDNKLADYSEPSEPEIPKKKKAAAVQVQTK